MEMERTELWEEGEYSYYNGKYQFICLDSYIHEDNEKRPGILIIPGGAYRFIAGNESVNVATKFYEMGYQAFVVCYTVNEPMTEPLKLQPLNDVSRAMRYIRKNSEHFKLYNDNLAVCGFSAGGHLAASLCVHHADIKDLNEKYADISNRPDVAILSYPVITTGYYTHEDSKQALLGEMAGLDEIKYMSLEKQINNDTPPCFIWTTATDDLVRIENSHLFSEALRAAGIPYAYHVFSTGRHGRDLGEATETEPAIPEIMVWPMLADQFIMEHLK